MGRESRWNKNRHKGFIRILRAPPQHENGVRLRRMNHVHGRTKHCDYTVSSEKGNQAAVPWTSFLAAATILAASTRM
jgi:hypothetical protein